MKQSVLGLSNTQLTSHCELYSDNPNNVGSEKSSKKSTPFDWSKSSINACRLSSPCNEEELSELIVMSHHSSADGISITYLIRDILQAIATHCLRQSLPVPPSRGLSSRKAPETISLLKPLPKFRRMSGSFPDVQPTRQNNRQWSVPVRFHPKQRCCSFLAVGKSKRAFMLRFVPLFS